MIVGTTVVGSIVIVGTIVVGRGGAEREVMHRHRRSTIDEATPVNRRRQPRAMVDADEPTALAAALAQARSVLGPSLLSPAAPTPRPRRPIDEPEPLARPGG